MPPFQDKMPAASRSRPARGAAQRVRTGIRTHVACISCKDRKLRCDGQVPACSNCRRNNLVCLVEDPATKRHQPRNYLETLEQHVIQLEKLLQEARSNTTSESIASIPSPNEPLHADRSQDSTVAVDNVSDDVGDLSSMIGTLSLYAAGAEPSYLGSSSAFAFARFIKPSLQEAALLSPIASRQDAEYSNIATPEPCPLPDYQTAVKLSNAYFQNVHAQYPFLHEPTFRLWEAALEDPFHVVSYNSTSLFFLNMIYAIGATLLPNAGCSAERLYVSAMLYIDDILCHDNLRSIQAVLCCAAYSLRSSKGTSHWKLGGQALRQCINLGYHRSQRRLKITTDPVERELQKRAFWSAYVMECSAAVMLGRPLSLHFEDIDVDFPLDLEESCFSSAGICGGPRSATDPPTLMTYAIHAFRIRVLIGCIQDSLYSRNTPRDPLARAARIQELFVELENWKDSAPPPMAAPESGVLSYFVSQDFFQASYNHATLQLFRLQITDSKNPAPDETFLKCLDTARRSCHSYYAQLRGKPIACTWGLLYELFLAGLTYLYCLWTSPAAREVSRQDEVSSTCMDCTMVLVILAERWVDAVPYRDIFQALVNRTMTMMADAQQGKQVDLKFLTPGQDMYAEELPQWMAEISETGVNVDLLLGELIDEFPLPSDNVNVE